MLCCVVVIVFAVIILVLFGVIVYITQNPCRNAIDQETSVS